jgi:hypothetical protein
MILLSAVTNVHHVTILHNVVLTFEAQGTMRPSNGFRAGFEQRIPVDGFRADEMFFQVGMDRSRSGLGSRVDGNCPGAAFVFTDGEK